MRRRRILLIDDERDIRMIVRMALAGSFDVLAAGSGLEGLRIAADERPDGILLDVMMPGMDGMQTMQALGANPETADIPVIFLTARLAGPDRDRYRDLGAAGVIEKPFDPMALPDTVAGILERPGLE